MLDAIVALLFTLPPYSFPVPCLSLSLPFSRPPLSSNTLARSLQANAIRNRADDLTNLNTIIMGYVGRKMKWTEIDDIINHEKATGNPLAGLIHSVDWEKSTVTVVLPYDPLVDGEDLEEVDMTMDYEEETGSRAKKKKKKKEKAGIGERGGESDLAVHSAQIKSRMS